MLNAQLLTTDDVMYRAAQAITVLHAHRAAGGWRVLALTRHSGGVDFVAVRGERLLQPSTSIGLKTDLGHLQHLQTRCASPLGVHPGTLTQVIEDGQAHALDNQEAADRVSVATWGLAGALDSLQRDQKKAPQSFRLWRKPTAGSSHETRQAVDAWIQQLRDAMTELHFVRLQDIGLGWDEVQVEDTTGFQRVQDSA